MRIAFLDPVFTWPPMGGAPLDLYYTSSGLQDLGHEVHLFHGAFPYAPTMPKVQPEGLGFETTEITFQRGEFTPEIAGTRFRHEIDAFKPDVVFQCFGFFMKPHLSMALAHYPQIARYYAYEPFCPLDYRLTYNGKTCPKNYLVTPNFCQKCVYNFHWKSLRTGFLDGGYMSEYVSGKAYSKSYYNLLVKTLRQYKGIIVYNHFTKKLLGDVNDNVHVIGGGVKLADFEYSPLEEKREGERAVILMTGRCDDYSKGMKVLQDAGDILAKERDDFVIHATHRVPGEESAHFKRIGWFTFDKMKQLYKDCDICVVPSIWEEPFGLVAVEAMALGRPVVVGNVGGLQEIVLHGETGYIYQRDSAEALANELRKLLDDPKLRRSMGDAGRKRVEDNYDWKQVISRHYPSLLESVMK